MVAEADAALVKTGATVTVKLSELVDVEPVMLASPANVAETA
jgi:hypothetical protein